MRVTLTLDEYLNEFEIFRVCQLLLDEYYELYPVDNPLDYESMVADQYPTLYSLLSITSFDLTWQEVWIVANITYSRKGVLAAVEYLCKSLGFSLEVEPYEYTDEETQETETRYTIKVGKVNTSSIAGFITYFNQLLKELLMYDKYDFKIDQIIIDYVDTIESRVSIQVDKFYNQQITLA